MRLQDFCLLFPLYLFLGSSVVRGDQILNNVTDTFIQQILDSWGVSGGVAVAVVRGDGQGNWNVETKGYGVATANGSQVTESTLFAMGSNSKLFNALATGLLLNNESISASWNAKIASLIPGWGLEDPFSTNKSAILDLLGHRTGMPRHDYSYKWSDSVPALIQKLQSQRASAEFRQVWQYNNNMYNTLSYLPTVLLPSKIPFARYVKEQIIDPLGLTSTTYAYDVAKLGHLADGFSRLNINYSSNPFTGTPKTFPFWTTYGGDGVNGEDGNVMSGAGGVISNAVDMATWLQMLLGEGLKPGTNTTIVSPDIIDTVASGITVMDAEAAYPELSVSVYGGGQMQSTYRGHVVVEHGGSVTGFNTLVTRLPFDNIGVAVLTNDNDYGTFWCESIRYRLLDEALNLTYVDWDSRIKQLAYELLPLPATPRPANATLPSASFASLAGVYENAGYGQAEFCYVSSPDPSQSEACKALASNASTILPGAVQEGIPTFIAAWDSPWATHIMLNHFDGNFFNVTPLISAHDPNNSSEPYWTYGVSALDSGASAEFQVDGDQIAFGFFGIWGAGGGIPDPQGNTLQERAEVWLEKA